MHAVGQYSYDWAFQPIWSGSIPSRFPSTLNNLVAALTVTINVTSTTCVTSPCSSFQLSPRHLVYLLISAHTSVLAASQPIDTPNKLRSGISDRLALGLGGHLGLGGSPTCRLRGDYADLSSLGSDASYPDHVAGCLGVLWNSCSTHVESMAGPLIKVSFGRRLKYRSSGNE